MVCNICATEVLPDASVCGKCGSRLIASCPACSAEVRAGAKFCSACGKSLISVVQEKSPVNHPSVPALAALERKQATLLFADFSGYTAFSAQMDPEDLHDKMRALWKNLDAIVVAHGGTPEKHSGDALMAVFGGWHSREEDPVEAVRAALEMQNWLKKGKSEDDRSSLQLRIGIHTGLVVVGPANHSGEFLATGDAVNLASRLEQNAPPGGVLVSRETYRHVYGFFYAQSLPLLKVKGKPEPLETYIVSGTKPRGLMLQMRGIEGVESEMIGRQQQ